MDHAVLHQLEHLPPEVWGTVVWQTLFNLLTLLQRHQYVGSSVTSPSLKKILHESHYLYCHFYELLLCQQCHANAQKVSTFLVCKPFTEFHFPTPSVSQNVAYTDYMLYLFTHLWEWKTCVMYKLSRLNGIHSLQEILQRYNIMCPNIVTFMQHDAPRFIVFSLAAILKQSSSTQIQKQTLASFIWLCHVLSTDNNDLSHLYQKTEQCLLQDNCDLHPLLEDWCNVCGFYHLFTNQQQQNVNDDLNTTFHCQQHRS